MQNIYHEPDTAIQWPKGFPVKSNIDCYYGPNTPILPNLMVEQ
jgi:hypothetical protein